MRTIRGSDVAVPKTPTAARLLVLTMVVLGSVRGAAAQPAAATLTERDAVEAALARAPLAEELAGTCNVMQ